MIREKATQAKDLPHQFDANTDGRCTLCRAGALDGLHLAWEVAAEEAANPYFNRETGT